MDTKDSIEMFREMIENGTFHMDTDSMALEMMIGQLRNKDGKITAFDRTGAEIQVPVFSLPTGSFIIGPSGAGRSFSIDDLIIQARKENPSFTEEEASKFVYEKYNIQIVEDTKE